MDIIVSVNSTITAIEINVLYKKLELPQENSSISIILCKEKNNKWLSLPLKSLIRLR